MWLSWIGNVLLIVGLWYVGKLKRWAWYFSMAGEMAWIAYSVKTHLWSLAFICGVFFVLAAKNWWEWGRKK